MKLLIILISLLVGCASNPDTEAHRLALWNFRYEKDIDNEYRIYDSISAPFYGDCEDFAFTLQRQIGGEVYYVLLPDKQAHAVLVVKGICYDNRYKRPLSKKKYRGEFIYIMDSKGVFHLNSKE